jgi:hypothetical protein
MDEELSEHSSNENLYLIWYTGAVFKTIIYSNFFCFNFQLQFFTDT